MKLFDTHAHIDQDDFDADRDAVVERAQAAGVSTIVAIGTTAAASALCVELATRYPGVYAAVGIQPNYVAQAVAGDWQRIVELARAPRVVAIGETGLDRYWDHTPFDMQQDYFDRHMRLAAELGLPFIVHMRDCSDDIMTSLQAEHARSGPLAGVMHSFTGDAAMAAECVALGMHISFAGMVTFKKSAELRAVAATIPPDRILIETDSPYLSPEPLRGQRRNEPANLIHTAACLATACGKSPEEFAAQTTRNAQQFFKIGER